MGKDDTLETRCRALLAEIGLADSGSPMRVTPLSGGVASDIARVDLENHHLCVKFALPKLKVAEEWQAPVHRNRAEYEWLRFAADAVPDSAVELHGHIEALQGFAMEYVAGDEVFLWKSRLLDGQIEAWEAEAVGDVLGRIHRASTEAGFDAAPFHNMDDFRALRIEPYLTFTATRWPDLAPPLGALATMLAAGARVLVHGDVSPKNILFRGTHPVLLDAECATMGDASFDPAFCLNHLILKAFHRPKAHRAMLDGVAAFWRAYAARVSWEDGTALERRVCHLIPALMLARVDGKSPVEYLDDAARDLVREVAVPLIRTPYPTVSSLREVLQARLEETMP